MGIFRTTIDVENPTRPGVTMQVESVMVDTDSEKYLFVRVKAT